MFEEYTIERCSQDLEALTGCVNLTVVQDTGKAATYKSFMNKQYSYEIKLYLGIKQIIIIAKSR